MFRSFTMEFLEELAIVLALVSTQFVYVVYAVFTSHLMSIGLTPLFLTIYGSLAISFNSSFFLSPFVSKGLLHHFPLHSFHCFDICLSVTLFQVLLLNGVKKTSPTLATAMPNLAPGFIFIIAWVLRFERVNVKCMYGVVKITGTAIFSNLLDIAQQFRGLPVTAATLGDFPAPISLSAVTAFVGAIITAVVQLVQKHNLEIGTPLVSGKDLVGYALMGGAVSGACTSFQTWAMKKKGPVFVSTFSPIVTVFSVILSAITLGESISPGSLFGMFLMFSGLYCLLWAKRREYFVLEDEESLKVHDEKKPLLS
ncbi:hypothetical protein IFM89_027313 [Coptis chinensis]|uniref:WAT1-related protein n=1 Tax=Coptis chinensis TaxID=261450 RepID=A0A835M9T6_9MAGN|nr:hypothetical protein IFM89_027313 [Coptis chinensis]